MVSPLELGKKDHNNLQVGRRAWVSGKTYDEAHYFLTVFLNEDNLIILHAGCPIRRPQSVISVSWYGVGILLQTKPSRY